MKEPSLEDVGKFLATHGKKGSMTMSLLGKLNHFVQAMNSPIGQEILDEDIKRHEELLVKLYNEDITPQETAEFRYLKKRIKTIAEKIAIYHQKTQEIINNGNKI